MSLLIGVSGDLGSYSEEAALVYKNKKQINGSLAYLIDMEGVLVAIEKNIISIGILPVYNVQGCLVKPSFDAMGRYLFSPIDDLSLEIKHCLLALPGTTLKTVNTIISHPQALLQCMNYLKKEFKNTDVIEWCDTAKAARDLAEEKLSPDTAVIASERCAELYGLDVIAKSIQDRSPNITIFIVVKKLI